MINPISEILSENNKISSMRFIFVIGSLTIIFVWAFLSLKAGSPISFNAWDVGVLATLIGGKDVQKFLEKKEEKK